MVSSSSSSKFIGDKEGIAFSLWTVCHDTEKKQCINQVRCR